MSTHIDRSDELLEWYAEDDDYEFWSARPVLGHVRDFARSRRVGPWSTLGVALVRALCQIPPHVVIEPLIGGHAALNPLLAIVGPPGAGKGGSEAAGRDAIRFVGLPAVDVSELPIGSAEGVARTFAPNDEQTIVRAIFSCPEIQTLAGLFRRQGSTLEAEIRKLAMGEQLGYANAQKHTRLIVKRLSYRAGMIVGVQPLKAAALLDGADGGTPQRFLWLPVLDAEMPEQRPAPVAPMEIEVQPWPLPDVSQGQYYVELKVPDVARAAIDAHQYALHRGDPDVDPLDGHAMLTRLKLSAGLMALDGRRKMSVADWSLAGEIMAVSDATRASVQAAMEQARRRDNRAKAYAADERDEYTSDRKLHRCKQTVLRWVDKLRDGEHISRRDLRQKLKADLRDYFDAAIAELTDEGKIEEITLDRGTGYTIGTPVHRGTPQSTCGDNGVPNGVQGHRWHAMAGSHLRKHRNHRARRAHTHPACPTPDSRRQQSN